MTQRPPQAVPTLTEVIDWPPPMGATPVPPQEAAVLPAADVPAAQPALPKPAALTDEDIVDGVLAAVQAAFLEADAALDQRLRDVLEPALARFADALIAGVRADFAAALRDVAAAAVAQELGRYRRG